METGIQVVAAGIEITVLGGAPSRRIKLLPIGTIAMRDGRGPYRVRDRAHADQIVAATRRFLGSADFNFDYDHQVLFAATPGVGGTAIAAGWAKASTLSVKDDGIYAEVDWTPAAAAKLAAREYRYLSPLFVVAKDGGDVIHLKNAALVNIGAIDLPAVAAGLCVGGQHIDRFAMTNAIGVTPGASIEEIAAVIGKMDGQMLLATFPPLSPDERALCNAWGYDETDFIAARAIEKLDAALAGSSMLTATERQLCLRSGISEAAFIAEKKAAISR